MFPPRYYASRFFAPRYFPPDTASAPAPAPAPAESTGGGSSSKKRKRRTKEEIAALRRKIHEAKYGRYERPKLPEKTELHAEQPEEQIAIQKAIEPKAVKQLSAEERKRLLAQEDEIILMSLL